jgi:hypothetical protein
MPVSLIAEFTLWPPGHHLGPKFSLPGFDFDDIPSSSTVISTVEEFHGVRLLQFPDAGLEVRLLMPLPSAELRVAQGGSSSHVIEGYDPGGTLLSSVTISSTDPAPFQDVQLLGSNLSLIRFTGGANEGRLVRLSVPIPSTRADHANEPYAVTPQH